jgi:hypothetical protein
MHERRNISAHSNPTIMRFLLASHPPEDRGLRDSLSIFVGYSAFFDSPWTEIMGSVSCNL